MKIVLCDDEPLFVEQLKELLTEYLRNAGVEFSIVCFYNGEHLLAYKEKFDLLFLDINLANMNGIEVASVLRKSTPGFVLVFISAYMEYALEGYEVEAFRYLLKSKLPVSFQACMDALLFHFGINRHEVEFQFVNGPQKLFVDKILYLESQKHTVFFHLYDCKMPSLKLYDTLDRVQSVLPADEFVRIHKSYLVNLRFIDNVVNYAAYLSNGVTLPVSQKNFAKTKREFFRFKGRQI